MTSTQNKTTTVSKGTFGNQGGNREVGSGRLGKRFFETSRAVENCIFEVDGIVGRRTMDIILFVSVIVYLIVTAHTRDAAIEKLKRNEPPEEKRIQRYRFFEKAAGIICLRFGKGIIMR